MTGITDATNPALFIVVLVAALGCGAVGGVFFAFSAFVMDGLARLPAPLGVPAMQSINVTAVRPAFMTALFGTAAVCVVVAFAAVLSWGDARAVLLLVGSGLCLLGTIALTIAYHVPRNDELARVDPGASGAEALWTRYVRSWTRANHVRAGASLAAAAAFVLALRV